jgi:DNA repair photolyase
MVEKLEEIGKENIHTLVIWTKNPRNMLVHSKLNRVLEKLDQIYVLLTVTGLGGTPLEPNTPSADQVFRQLPAIIDFIDSPRRLAFRYDPLIDVLYQGNERLCNLDIIKFSDILSRAHFLGVERVIVSYVTLYRKVIKRLKANNFEVLEHPLEEITGFIQNQMKPQAENLGMELSTCVLPNLTQKGCIDARTLIEMHPLRIPCSQAKDKTQRGECHCTKSLDIGQWFSCYHGCVYCYGNPIKE